MSLAITKINGLACSVVIWLLHWIFGYGMVIALGMILKRCILYYGMKLHLMKLHLMRKSK